MNSMIKRWVKIWNQTHLRPVQPGKVACQHGARAGYLPTRGAAQLCAWLLIGGLATVLVTDRRRYLSTRRLRLRADHPAVVARPLQQV
jgi:putative membrane protein